MTSGHWGSVLGENAGLQVINCTPCGYAHLAELPTAAQVVHYYGEADAFYAGMEGHNWFIKQSWEHKRGLWNAAYADRVRLLKNGRSILDVGCEMGWFVGYCHYHNINAYGIEPSLRAREHSQVTSSLYGSLTALAAFNGSLYTFLNKTTNIHISLVLEHVLDPGLFLAEYRALMGTGSRLMIIVPNEFSPLQAKLGTTHFIKKEHINYWTPKSLWCFLRREGLRVVAQSATFPTELFKLMFRQDYITNQEIGRRCHLHRLHFEQCLGQSAFRFYRLLYRKLGWSRELVFVAEKTNAE